MKPKPSPLNCTHYFVTDLSVSANPLYDPESEIDLTGDSLDIESRVEAPEDDEAHWQIILDVSQNLGPEANAPYNFGIQIIGFFQIQDGFPKDKETTFLSINGSSLLFGVAREMLRNAMTAGPHAPLMLPTVSFFDPALLGKAAKQKSASKKSAKKGQKKKPKA